ncbi:immunoglobulin superfamily member 6 isoform X2 [Astyanax mexicanus]|uniref:immunoglobulin superfamily member 6 isoform X2 n=1 Tax=Astyanax mexicanus TaxID=7994 RepID=UPI000BBD8704|nr:immunoglobulin superfamily member 6 isoform X2 [Astyanax mexicanus]
MVLYIFQITLFLLFITELSASGCSLEVRQPNKQLFGEEHQSISISCNISISSCSSSSPEVVWYVFTSGSHHQLDTKNHPTKYHLKNHQLQISQLTSSDDGVYYCAVAISDLTTAGAQAFGTGTTVTVHEPSQYAGRSVLLALLVLLVLYDITLLTYMICIKTGRGSSFFNGRFRKSDTKIDSSKKVHFGAVVQELYNRRNLHKKSASASGEASPDNKIENPHFQTEGEDIYQNLERTG